MGSTSPNHPGLSVAHLFWHCLLICIVFALWSSPIIHPVKIMVVLFHEMSHGLMAILTGGKVISIAVTPDEGGACETEGGIASLIVSAGYLGSMFFGGLILYLSRFRNFVPVVYIILTVVVSGAIFTVLRDPYSRTFATGLAVAFIAVGLLAPGFLGAVFLSLLGIVSCTYSIFDIYSDVLAGPGTGGYVENDAVAFARLTGISSEAVGISWMIVSIVYFVVILKLVMQAQDEPQTGGQPQPA